jgi:alpha-N-arabinofuranosidase
MKWTDPSVRLIAAGSSNFGPGADWTGWNRTVLEYLKHHADYLSLHRYVGNSDEDYYDFLASALDLDDKIETAEGIIRAALSGEPRSRKIYIAFDEWNVWYRARGNAQRGRRILEEHYNLEDALVVATFLNSFVNHAQIVKIANMAQLVNVIAPIFTNEKGLFLQTIYYPLQLFANNTKGKALELFIEAPKYKTKRFDEVSYLDASAGYDNGSLVMNVVNRHKDQPLDAEFVLEDKTFSGPVSVTEVNGPELKSQNDFGSTTVQATERSATAQGNTLRQRFPPHSYTMLKARLS